MLTRTILALKAWHSVCVTKMASHLNLTMEFFMIPKLHPNNIPNCRLGYDPGDVAHHAALLLPAFSSVGRNKKQPNQYPRRKPECISTSILPLKLQTI
jgi:hypothetical protein